MVLRDGEYPVGVPREYPVQNRFECPVGVPREYPVENRFEGPVGGPLD